MSLLAGALIANAADLDFLLVAGLKSKAWHRGFTHSIVFAFLICLLFLLTPGREQFRNALGYGLAFTSHGLLDYVTAKNGGGVELLWPFSTSKFTLGWWGLSEVPSQMTTVEILEALALEAALFSLLFLSILVLRKTLVKRMSAAI